MKKILVVLLVLAVATGVFAQEGEWSLSGKAEMGAAINFDPKPAEDGVKATSTWTQYDRTYEGWNGLRGLLGISYNRDVVGAGLDIDSNNGGEPLLIGSLNANGDNYQFTAKSRLVELINGNGPGINQLWGNYQFLNGVFFLETAYRRGWVADNLWTSDTVGGFRNGTGRLNEVVGGNPFRTDIHATNSFTKRDGDESVNGYILGDVRLQGLSFGLMMRDVFVRSKTYYVANKNADDWTKVTGDSSEDYFKTLIGNYGLSEDEWNDLKGSSWIMSEIEKMLAVFGDNSVEVPTVFVDDVLKKMIFGVKFEMSPIEVAAQFLMEDYGVYIGAKWMVGPVTVGLSYMGILNEKTVDEINLVTYERKYKATDATHMKVGGGVDYEADSFGGWLKGFYAIDGNKDEAGKVQISEIGVEPGFYYNVIPSHLRFQLNTGFYFYSYNSDGEKNGDKADKQLAGDGTSTVQFALQPQLFWNFLGTGAGKYGGTGIALRYRLVGGDAKKYNPLQLNNKFDVNFSYSF